MPFTIVRQDITKMQTDAIVNAANTELLMGGGVCGAIFRAAGAERLQEACRKKAPIRTGTAVITPGFDLKAKYIIHAAGPVYRPQQTEQCGQLLRSVYTESLKLAGKHRCKSIAFPLISSGIYGYPKAEAMQAATAAIREFLEDHEMDVYLAIYDKESLAAGEALLGKAFLKEVERYIDDHYVEAHQIQRRNLLNVERITLQSAKSSVFDRHSTKPPTMSRTEESSCTAVFSDVLSREIPRPGLAEPTDKRKQQPASAGNLEDMIGNLDEPFNMTLLRLIDAKGKTDAQVYKRANIDRKLFSKIRLGKGYLPGKRTVLALAIALELTLEETDDLLERAGYALSHSQKFDVIIEYFIVNGKYDIFEINEVLFQYDQPLLGAG